MENLELSSGFWSGRRVLVTGHTGFKGGWTSLALTLSGAEVHGFSLPPGEDSMFYGAVSRGIGFSSNNLGDVCNLQSCLDVVNRYRPEVIFHLAAQPLVRESYVNPLETYNTNVMGVAHILEAVRQTECVKAVVNVTTDKCYENMEWPWPYRENEPLGGRDPYSSSKACSEIISAAYKQSYFDERGVALATARAGNVVGGGDWSTDRLLPDMLRAIDASEEIVIRSPDSVRPWQHVLEPVTGYILLAQNLLKDHEKYGGAWNFGPEEIDCWSVSRIADYVCNSSDGARWVTPHVQQPHEARLLKLDSSKAKAILGWRPKWSVEQALSRTMDWHRNYVDNADMYDLSVSQIKEYQAV